MARVMKDSGIEWIGEIPETWKTSKLKYLVRQKADRADNNSKYIGLENVESWTGRYLAQGDSSFEAEGTSLAVRTGDILFGKLRPYLAKCYITEENCSCSTEFVVMTPTVIYPSLLKYIILSPTFIDEVNMSTYGSKMPRANWTFIGNMVLPLPDIDEQRRIADFLDRKCAEIDSVIANTRQTIEEYKALKQSIITEAVTKGVRGPRPMKDSGIEWIGKIPEEWNIIAHKYVMHKEKNICEHYQGENIISLSMDGVKVRDLDAGGKMPTTFDGYQYVEPEDMLLCLFDIDVTPRCVGIVKNKGVTSPAYSKFKIHAGYFNRYYDYLLRFMDDKKVLVHLAKNLRSSLTETDFGVIKTIVPNMQEQKEIVDYLDIKCTQIDSLIASKQNLLTELETYKKSVIYEYVTGKKEVV